MHQRWVVHGSSHLITLHHRCAELQVEQMRLKKQQQQQESGTGRKYKFVSQLNDQGFIEGAHLFLPAITCSSPNLSWTAEVKGMTSASSLWKVVQRAHIW